MTLVWNVMTFDRCEYKTADVYGHQPPIGELSQLIKLENYVKWYKTDIYVSTQTLEPPIGELWQVMKIEN